MLQVAEPGENGLPLAVGASVARDAASPAVLDQRAAFFDRGIINVSFAHGRNMQQLLFVLLILLLFYYF